MCVVSFNSFVSKLIEPQNLFIRKTTTGNKTESTSIPDDVVLVSISVSQDKFSVSLCSAPKSVVILPCLSMNLNPSILSLS